MLYRSLLGWLSNAKKRRKRLRGLGAPWQPRNRPFVIERLEDRAMLSIVPGTVTGTGTMLQGQDAFSSNVVASVIGGVSSFSGQLSFSDSKAGDTFQSATITSVQIEA